MNKEELSELLDMFPTSFIVERGFMFGSVKPTMEWIKWLSYESDREKNKKRILYSKCFNELTMEEKNEIFKFNDLDRMKSLFLKYSGGKCSKEEFLEVYDYMGNSIEELMDNKLSKEELEYVKEKIEEIQKLSNEEIKVIIEEYESNYKMLSMVYAYILHYMYKIYKQRLDLEFDKQIMLYDLENVEISRKSGIYSQKTLC